MNKNNRILRHLTELVFRKQSLNFKSVLPSFLKKLRIFAKGKGEMTRKKEP
jgi:hypothetical protein